MEMISMKMQSLKVVLIVVTAKFAVAVTTILYKLAENDVMQMWVLITYRYLFASIIIFPLALFLERNKRPKPTWTLLFQAFLCAFLMGPVSQYMYAQSLQRTSATSVAAISNLVPPFTFVIAVLFRSEKVGIRKITGKAKVIGTLIGVGGAMILTFYKGHQLNIKSIHLHLLRGGQHMATNQTPRDHIFGFIFALAYSLFIALYYNFQRKLSANYPCHYSNAFFYSGIGFIQSFVYANITERSWSQWKLHSKIRLFSAIFQGICSALAICLVMAAVHLQGPLFVSSFHPLVLVYVAIVGYIVLEEKLYVGSLLGSVIIIAGLYMVLWAKSKETKRLSKLTPFGNSKDVNATSNAISTTTTLETMSMTHTSFLVKIDEGFELPAISPREKHKEQEIVEEV